MADWIRLAGGSVGLLLICGAVIIAIRKKNYWQALGFAFAGILIFYMSFNK